MTHPESIPTCIESFLKGQFEAYFAAHGEDFPAPGLYARVIARIERPLLAQTLAATGGNQIKAAEILGLNRNTLRKKIRALGIDVRERRR